MQVNPSHPSQALPAQQGKRELLHTIALKCKGKATARVSLSLRGGGQAVSTGERLEPGSSCMTALKLH